MIFDNYLLCGLLSTVGCFMDVKRESVEQGVSTKSDMIKFFSIKKYIFFLVNFFELLVYAIGKVYRIAKHIEGILRDM